jgi:hypothetical protein
MLTHDRIGHGSDIGQRGAELARRPRGIGPSPLVGLLGDPRHGPAGLPESRFPSVVALQRAAGNRATTLLLTRDSRHPEISVSRGLATVQRFDTDEHEWLGSIASSGATVAVTSDYRLTYGEMVAMAGDYFSSLQQMRSLAARPGPGAGTRDELEYVRRVKVHGERLVVYDDEWLPNPMGFPSPNPSYQAKLAADARYYALAGRNQSHFLNPKGEGGVLADPEAMLAISGLLEVAGIPASSVLSGAAQNYRVNHVKALRDAVVAGQTRAAIDDAMASEAFGGHFLTDAFAAGHVRTQRTSITEHWSSRAPLFGVKLEGFIAESLAEELQAAEYTWRISEGVSVAVDEDVLYGVALGKVRAALSTKGSFGFADVVAGALHDYENEHGVPVVVETDIASEVVVLHGDEHLGEGAERALAIRAVELGIGEIQSAYDLGAKGKSVGAVLKALCTDGKFAPERAMPTPLPDEYGTADQARIPWEFETVDELLANSRFERALRVFFAAKSAELESATADLDPAQAAAFRRVVIVPLQTDPVSVIRWVLAWTPSTGGGFLAHNTDDHALDLVERAKAASGLGAFTLRERQTLIRDLLDGATVGSDEDAIMDLLNSASDSDRHTLINEFGWDRLHDEIDDLLGEVFAGTYPAGRYR